MEDMQQLLILMSDDGKHIGTETREECHKGLGKRHWGYILLLKYPDNRYIFSRRSNTKSCGANLWDASVVSHVISGETLFQAIRRRTPEELGVTDISEMNDIGGFVYTAPYGKWSENEYCSVVLGMTNQMPDPNPKEISETKLLTIDQIVNDIKRDESIYAPWLVMPFEKFLKQIKDFA